jgi:hypothetical protein
MSSGDEQCRTAKYALLRCTNQPENRTRKKLIRCGISAHQARYRRIFVHRTINRHDGDEGGGCGLARGVLAAVRHGPPATGVRRFVTVQRMRLRILFGMIALVVALAAYGLAVAAVAAHALPANRLLAAAFYAAAGLAWIVPARALVRWMARAPPHRPPPAG